jgi:serine/threonine protein kinase
VLTQLPCDGCPFTTPDHNTPVWVALIPFNGFEKPSTETSAILSSLNIEDEVKELLAFLDHFHNQGWYHHDVKLQNMLLRKTINDKYELCFCDYGAFVSNDGIEMLSTFPCTLMDTTNDVVKEFVGIGKVKALPLWSFKFLTP